MGEGGDVLKAVIAVCSWAPQIAPVPVWFCAIPLGHWSLTFPEWFIADSGLGSQFPWSLGGDALG